jgi:virulence factor Mce-like protein
MTAGAATRRDDARRRRQIRAGLVAALLIAAVVYLAFAKSVPFTSHFEVSSVVRTSYALKPGNPVRIAGLDVGRVTGVEAGPDGTSVVTMRLDHHDELRADASLSIEPRLFLEGNDYVDLRPGTPGAAPLRDGARIPLARTSGAVQLDQVLGVLDAPTRTSLQTFFREVGHGLAAAPPGRAGSGASGAAGLRDASRELARALPGFTRVADAARGTRTGDLARTVGSSRDVVAQLAADPRALADLVTDVDRVAATFAARDAQVRASITGLDRLVGRAPARLAAIDAVLGPLRRFAADLRPALRAAPGPLRDTSRLLDQLDGLVRPQELGGLVRELRPVTGSLPAVESALRTTFPLLTDVSRCVSRNIVPTLDKEVPDGKLSTGRPAWQDLLHMAAALTGTSPGFDGNGGTLRISVAEGANAMRGFLPGLGQVVSPANLEGVRPTWLGYGVTPQFRPDAPCDEQALPDLGARSSGAGQLRGWTKVPTPSLDGAARGRKATLLELLYGTPKDHRKLLKILLGDLPLPKARKRHEAVERPAAEIQKPAAGAAGPEREPSRPAAPAPPVPVPEPVGKAIQSVGRTVQDVVKGLGGLLGGRPGEGGGR